MNYKLKEHSTAFIAFLVIILFLSIITATWIGAVNIPIIKVVKIILSRFPLMDNFIPQYNGPNSTIILLIRLPRVLLGAIAGMCLAVSGSSMQGVFKNPMASPFILGVSSGGALGAAIGYYFGIGIYLLPLIAFLFAILTVLIVFSLGRVRGKTNISTLLLSGLAMNFFMSALYSYVLFMSPPEKRVNILTFTWGSLNGTIWEEVLVSFILLIIGFIAVFAYARNLNVIQMGEESALQLGINVERTKIIQLISASFLAATIIAFTGVIGFVGLIIPHAARIIIGPDHKRLIPTSAVMGGIFLVFCDTLSRTNGEIWVGIITGLFGAPFFLYLLIRTRGDTGW